MPQLYVTNAQVAPYQVLMEAVLIRISMSPISLSVTRSHLLVQRLRLDNIYYFVEGILDSLYIIYYVCFTVMCVFIYLV